MDQDDSGKERSSSPRDKRVSELFLTACDMSAGGREAFLDQACAGDPELRAAVESLLAHDATGVLGTRSLTEQVRGMHSELGTDAHPTRIGPYKILEVLGEGGMGIVYIAEQEKPVRRRVAVKVIKRGMDTRQVVARFEAERQALAMMNHPNVAKVFDAGSTEQGRPYFAMELVKGESLTKYCDRQRLTNSERLELFMQICEGVQHAHQKGVIHRDIKPSNILVQIEDDRQVPKIIDFGVAKATQQRLTERTLFTELGVLIGTPEYMSPEQAEMTVQDIDTRTDVYSLGVLLYELLVGALPFDPRELREAGFDEIRRRIREEEPSKPSARISTLGDASTDSARKRRTDPASLARRLSGDLDWITMKALEKDRTRRYGSPTELAADLARHLRHEPVVASPPSTSYRAAKFVRRHRLAVSIGVATFLFLASFAGRERMQSNRIAEERDRANREAERAGLEAETAQQVSDFLVGLFKFGSPWEARGKAITVQEILDRGSETIATQLEGQPRVQARLMEIMGHVYRDLALYEPAERLLQESLRIRRGIPGEKRLNEARSLHALAWLYQVQARYTDAEALERECVEILEAELVSDDPVLATCWVGLGRALRDRGEYERARPALERGLSVKEGILGPDHIEVAYGLQDLGWLFKLTGEYPEAKKAYERALHIMEEQLEPDDPGLAWCLNGLSVVLQNMGDYVGARPLLERAVAIREKVLGPDHPDLAASLNDLGVLVGHHLSDYGEARSHYERALEIRRKAFGPEDPRVAQTLSNLGLLAIRTGDHARAQTDLRGVLKIQEQTLGPDHPSVASTLHNLGYALLESGDYSAARRAYDRALEILEQALGPEHPAVAQTLFELGTLHRTTGDSAEALKLFARSLAIREEVLGPEHPLLAATLFHVAATSRITGSTDGVEALFRRSLAIGEKAQESQFIVAADLLGLARLCASERRQAEAESFYSRAAAIVEDEGILGEHAKSILRCHEACYWALLGDREKALQFLRQVAGRGFHIPGWVVHHPDLASLRGDPEFEAIVADVKKRVGGQ